MADFISSYTGEQIDEAVRRALSFEQSSIASVKLPSTELIPYSLNSLPASGSYMIEYVTNGPVDLVGVKPIYIQAYSDALKRYQMITMGNKTYLRSGLISSGENITWSEWANYNYSEKGEEGTDVNYVHDQISSAKEWRIIHSLGKYPSVSIVDTGGNMVVGEVHYISINEVIIRFTFEFSGKAYLN